MMTDNSLVVFRPKRVSLLKSAAVAAAGTTVIQVATLWWFSAPVSFEAGAAAFAAGFVAIFGVIWGVRLFRARREAVSISSSGLQGPDTGGGQRFCGWENITDARVIRGGQTEYLLISGRYLAQPLRVPIELLDDQEFVRTLDQYVPEGSHLSLALRIAGA